MDEEVKIDSEEKELLPVEEQEEVVNVSPVLPSSEVALKSEVFDGKILIAKSWVDSSLFPRLEDYVELVFDNGSSSRIPSYQLVEQGVALPSKS